MTANAHEKVVWFDVSVDEVLCVYILNSADHLKMKKGPQLNISELFTTLIQIMKMIPSIQLVDKQLILLVDVGGAYRRMLSQ